MSKVFGRWLLVAIKSLEYIEDKVGRPTFNFIYNVLVHRIENLTVLTDERGSEVRSHAAGLNGLWTFNTDHSDHCMTQTIVWVQISDLNPWDLQEFRSHAADSVKLRTYTLNRFLVGFYIVCIENCVLNGLCTWRSIWPYENPWKDGSSVNRSANE